MMLELKGDSVGTLLARAEKSLQRSSRSAMRDEATQMFTMKKLELLQEKPELQDDAITLAWQRTQAEALSSRPNSSKVSWTFAAAAGLGVVLLLTPAGRATAEAMWRSLTLTHVENVSFDFSKTTVNLLLPNVFPMSAASNVETQRTESVTEASSLADFSVRGLRTPHLPYPPSIKVIDAPEIQRTIDLAAIQTDLRQLGRILPKFPTGIDGAQIRLKSGSKTVHTSYGQCPQLIGPWKACAFLLQSRPSRLELPSGLAVDEYIRFSLELAGFSPEKTDALVRLHRAQPTLFIPLKTNSEIRQVRVRGTTGMLIVYEKTNSVDQAFVLDWQEDRFLFRIFGRNFLHAIEMAETLQ